MIIMLLSCFSAPFKGPGPSYQCPWFGVQSKSGKVAVKSLLALPNPRLTESDWFHLRLCPYMWGPLQKNGRWSQRHLSCRKNVSPVWLPKHEWQVTVVVVAILCWWIFRTSWLFRNRRLLRPPPTPTSSRSSKVIRRKLLVRLLQSRPPTERYGCSC